MRKSLLITSALGLVSALPTFAMANAAAGSSAAACGSGFFAQFDAKILNAKLEIKNEKKVEAKDTTDAEAAVIEEQEAAYKDKMQLIFSGLSAEQSAKLRATKALGGLNMLAVANAIDNDDDIALQKALLLAVVPNAGLDVAVPNAAADAQGNQENEVAGTVADNNAINAANNQAEINRLVQGGSSLLANGNLALDAPNGPIAGGAGLTLEVWKQIVKDAKDLAASFDLASIRNAAVPIALGAFMRNALTPTGADVNLIGPKAVINVNAPGTSISFGNATSKRDLSALDKLFVFASAEGQVTYNDKATFNVEQLSFLNTPALKEARVAALKANSGWFATAVKNKADVIKTANDAINKLNENLDRRVHHHALAGGVGATAGWWQNMGSFAVSISGSGDYHWGTFRTVDDAASAIVEAKNKRKLGFGFQGDLGVHYVVSPSTTLGVLVGFRGQQLQIGRDKTATTPTSSKDSKGDYASKWMWNPTVSAQARTFFTDSVYGALTVGYIIPIERDYKLENTPSINKDAKVRLQGLTGAFSVGMMF
jgi:hypothetical protein